MRIYGKDIDIQGEGANANISLSFSRTNMFSFGMDIPKCQILQPPITPMADYCCKYPAVIAGGVGLPVMNVCVNAISKNSVNLCIETAANGDVPIYELFKDSITCGCCRPVTPAVTDALHCVGMQVYALPVFETMQDCITGGYAGGCLFYEPLTACEHGMCNTNYAMTRDCYGIVCSVDLGLPSGWDANGESQHSRDVCWQKFESHLIDVNDFTFAWKWNNFVECASCWWECNCGVPIRGVPDLGEDVAIVFPNTREFYMCSPWVMWEGAAYTYCEYIAPKCVFDAGCMPRPLSLNFATWAIELPGRQYFMRNDLGCYTFDGATHIGGVDTAMPLVVSLYRNGTIYRSRVAFCSDYITCAQVVDIMDGVGLCCNILYSAVSDSTQLQDMSVPIAVSPSCYDVCVIAFAVDPACKCYPMFGNLMQGATSLVSSDFHYVHIDGGWGTEDVHTHDDSMCYGCVCLPWIGNFFGCGVIDTIRRVVTTLGCYMNGADVYSPSGKTFAINCALDYCVYNCSIYQCGYVTAEQYQYINCSNGSDGATPLLGQLAERMITEQPERCLPIIDPYAQSVTYECARLITNVNMPYIDVACIGFHAQLVGCCSQFDFAKNFAQDSCCIYALVCDCARTEIALAKLTQCGCGYGEGVCAEYNPVVCGDYGKGYAAVGLSYPMEYRACISTLFDGVCAGTYSYDVNEREAAKGYCLPMYRCMCQPSKLGVRNNAVTLTTQPSDTNTILSNGVGSCFVWNGARYRIERIDNYNPTAATCLKVFGVMV